MTIADLDFEPRAPGAGQLDRTDPNNIWTITSTAGKWEVWPMIPNDTTPAPTGFPLTSTVQGNWNTPGTTGRATSRSRAAARWPATVISVATSGSSTARATTPARSRRCTPATSPSDSPQAGPVRHPAIPVPAPRRRDTDGRGNRRRHHSGEQLPLERRPRQSPARPDRRAPRWRPHQRGRGALAEAQQPPALRESGHPWSSAGRTTTTTRCRASSSPATPWPTSHLTMGPEAPSTPTSSSTAVLLRAGGLAG